jgi:hypothetical protein
MQTKKVERTERKKKEQEDNKEHEWNITVILYRYVTRTERDMRRKKEKLFYGKYTKFSKAPFELTVRAKGKNFPLPLSVPIDRSGNLDEFIKGQHILETDEDFNDYMQTLVSEMYDAFVVTNAVLTDGSENL